MVEFFQTRMGQTFFEGTLPRLIKAIERLSETLEKRETPNIEPFTCKCGCVDFGFSQFCVACKSCGAVYR